MIAILSLIVVLVISLLVVRIATVALTLTGISGDLARFQARSAFTGAGFTTGESEKVVGHPLRRRIIGILMLLGNAGIVTAVSSLILSFSGLREAEGFTGSLWFRMTMLIAGLSALLLIAQSKWVDRWMSRVIRKALNKWTTLDVRDYAGLLHLAGDYAVVELNVKEDDWLAGNKLKDLGLNREGILVLGIERAGGHNYIGAPRGDTAVEPGDTVALYGRQQALASLDERRRGSEGGRKHVEAVAEQAHVSRAEAEEDEARKGEGSE